jgi:predicted negative regulator of RcsB-dependent stress response
MSAETGICGVCGQALGEDGRCARCSNGEHPWTLQGWKPVLQLAVLIALGFSFTRLVVSSWDAQRQSLASEYYAAGIGALHEAHPGAAVASLEDALIYSHDNYQYQLKLTDALLESGATSEAVDQLHSFLEQKPDDAEVNLKLARLEARRHHVDEALRYYVAAIEGEWPEHTDPFPQRIAVRFEAAEYLVGRDRMKEASQALQALAGVLPAVWPEQSKLGDLFLRVNDPERALNAYETVLNNNHDDAAALLGAARASLAMGNYGNAGRYLRELRPATDESKELQAELEKMESMDPFAPSATAEQRVARTLAAYRIATARLEQCSKAARQEPPSKTPEPWNVLHKWAEQLAPLMNERRLRGRDDAIESTMRFAFQAEMTADKDCASAGSDEDETLLQMAQGRMGEAP